MDHSRFDDITKGFAASSRRSLLGIAGGAALAAWLGRENVKAKKKKCKKPKAKCGKACVNRKTDARHCGACGNACAAGQTCVNGACVGGGECRFGQPGADQACCPPGFPNCDPNDTRFSIHRRCESDGVCRCPKTAVDNKPRPGPHSPTAGIAAMMPTAPLMACSVRRARPTAIPGAERASARTVLLTA